MVAPVTDDDTPDADWVYSAANGEVSVFGLADLSSNPVEVVTVMVRTPADRMVIDITGLNPIPAMTTDAERECYYRLVKDNASKGQVIELGAWMGASTAYIAAGIRDSGEPIKAQVYDQFISKAGHIRKVEEFYDMRGIDKAPVGPSLEAFKDNLGPLLEYVEPHQGKIEQMKWNGEPIAVLITDAPKRVPAISSVLTTLRKGLRPGSLMAWQDFCHFPSYEIPACLYAIRRHIEFVEAVVPGTTLVFRVSSPIPGLLVSTKHLALNGWTPEEIDDAWIYWSQFVPKEKAALFECGAAMFMCDIGKPKNAVTRLRDVYRRDADAIIKKWRYLKDARPDFVTRYHPLFAYLEGQGVFETEAA